MFYPPWPGLSLKLPASEVEIHPAHVPCSTHMSFSRPPRVLYHMQLYRTVISPSGKKVLIIVQTRAPERPVDAC